jgi:hypothetical protein
MPQAMRAGEGVFMGDKIARYNRYCNGWLWPEIGQGLIPTGVLQLN